MEAHESQAETRLAEERGLRAVMQREKDMQARELARLAKLAESTSAENGKLVDEMAALRTELEQVPR